MILKERENTMVASYPEETNCFCGKLSHLSYKTIDNKYDDRIISVKNVPVYECRSFHDKLARKTRIRLNHILEVAYMSGDTDVEYIE